MSIADDRTANVRAIAARITKQAEGLSIREFFDACALAAGTLIRLCYRGPAVDIAVEKHCDEVRRAAHKETA